ncbi:MAG: MFS transporter [Chloroflexi bacterium]|nr:MAG: MFS transporter [Chloroflexota bacterium]
MDPIRLPVEAPGGFRGALSHTAFRNIWFAQLAAQLADKFLLFSLIILAYHISGGSTSVAVTLLAYTVPAVLFAPPAGVIADRFDRKRIMVWCNVGRAVVVALIPIASLIHRSPTPRADHSQLYGAAHHGLDVGRRRRAGSGDLANRSLRAVLVRGRVARDRGRFDLRV